MPSYGVILEDSEPGPGKSKKSRRKRSPKVPLGEDDGYRPPPPPSQDPGPATPPPPPPDHGGDDDQFGDW